MKKLTTPILLAICLILAFLLYKEYNKDSQEFEKPEGLISEEQANTYEENYKANQYNFINNALNGITENDGTIEVDPTKDLEFKDSRSVRFTIKELENYIHYVKQEAKQKELDGELSLRIYFGAKQVKFEKQAKSILRSTLFFVPTHREITRNPEDKHKNIGGISPLNYGSSGDPKDIEYNTGG